MAEPTVTSTNSLAQDNRLLISNLQGGYGKVASATATTITLDATAFATGKAQYSATNPGQVKVIEGVATTDHGKTADITGFSGNVLTVDVDLTTAIADGDIVFVIPPLAAEILPNQGHSLKTGVLNDDSMGLGEAALSHNTRLNTTVSGDIPFFLSTASEPTARLLLMGLGVYKKSATGVHDYINRESNDATYDEDVLGTIYSEDGNGVVRQAWSGLMGTQLTLNFPTNAIATGNLSVLGNAWSREVGGSGKLFTQGANNFVPASTQADTTSRFTSQRVFVEFGGSYGDALTDAVDRSIIDATVSFTRTPVDNGVLGNEYIVAPVEDMQDVTVAFTRILEDDAKFEDYIGDSTDAGTGTKDEDRLLLHAVAPDSLSRVITLDVPRSIITDHTINRQRGRNTETFTVKALQTLSSGLPSTTTPLFRLRYNNGLDVDYVDAL